MALTRQSGAGEARGGICRWCSCWYLGYDCSCVRGSSSMRSLAKVSGGDAGGCCDNSSMIIRFQTCQNARHLRRTSEYVSYRGKSRSTTGIILRGVRVAIIHGTEERPVSFSEPETEGYVYISSVGTPYCAAYKGTWAVKQTVSVSKCRLKSATKDVNTALPPLSVYV